VSELQDLLAQATKGIAALAAQSGATDKGKPTMKKSSSPKKNSRSQNSGRGRYGRNSGQKQDPKVDPCHTCGKVGHWANAVISLSNVLRSRCRSTLYHVSLCH